MIVRRAEPDDAAALVALAEDVGREEGRWILTSSSWRSVSDERRYLKAVQGHADAAVFVAEDDGRAVGVDGIAHLLLARTRMSLNDPQWGRGGGSGGSNGDGEREPDGGGQGGCSNH